MTGLQSPQVDLTNCDEEPIHIPGSIQPHGCLLAFDVADRQLRQWSANAREWLGDEPTAGTPLETIFPDIAGRVERVLGGPPGIVHPLRLEYYGRKGPTAVHWYDDMLIVELEQETDSAAETLESLPLRLNLANQQLQACPDLESLYAAIAERVREISGYDRVMVYRFMAGGHGAVVGEAVGDEFEPFLGLHYPATDIPQQARRLYTLNTVRSIADILAQPVPLEPAVNPTTGRPLDLSYSCYRAVSPIHVEYLRNMGVRASMSISILRDGELWGLIACHHYSPRYLTLEQRAACEMLGLMSGTYLTAREQFERNRLRSQRQSGLAVAMRELAAADSFRQGVQSISGKLIDVLQADGLAICWRGRVDLFGSTPEQSVVQQVSQWAESHRTAGCRHTDHLSESLELEKAATGKVAGCLAVPLEADDLQGLLFFRDEYAREVTWGGDPHKAVSREEDETVRLSPRLSFVAWKELVRGRSREWSDTDQAMSEEIRGGLIELLSRRTAELARINQELLRLNHDLDSFAHAASHDLREPIRGLRHTIRQLRQELGTEPAEAVRDRCEALERLAGRMDELITGMLRLSHAGRGDLQQETFRLADVVKDASDFAPEVSGQKQLKLTVDDNAEVTADFLCLRELFTNLIVNSLKYHGGGEIRVEVGQEFDSNRLNTDGRAAAVYFVRDNGIGIEDDQIGEVFQIFRRLHPPDAYGGGTGTGLAIVKKIVQRHGGDVWIESAPGRGTTVKFTLEPSQG